MRNAECGFRSAVAPRGFDRGDSDRDQLVGFLFNDAHLSNEVRSRFRAASSAIVSRDGCAGTHNLRRKRTPRRRLRHRVDKFQNPKRKCLRPLLQIRLTHSFGHSAFRIPHYFSGTGVTFIPACSSCRRVETTFSPSLSPLFTIRFPSKRGPVSSVRRSIVLSGFTTNAYFRPCCELITLSSMRAARYGVAPATRTRTKKPGVMKFGFQFFRTPRARTVPVLGSRRLSTKSM